MLVVLDKPHETDSMVFSREFQSTDKFGSFAVDVLEASCIRQVLTGY